MTFIRRFIAAHPGDETRLFLSDDGECTAAKVDAWGADLVHVNHLKALLQLLRNPFRRPKGRVVFVVHGVHLHSIVVPTLAVARFFLFYHNKQSTGKL